VVQDVLRDIFDTGGGGGVGARQPIKAAAASHWTMNARSARHNQSADGAAGAAGYGAGALSSSADLFANPPRSAPPGVGPWEQQSASRL